MLEYDENEKRKRKWRSAIGAWSGHCLLARASSSLILLA